MYSKKIRFFNTLLIAWSIAVSAGRVLGASGGLKGIVVDTQGIPVPDLHVIVNNTNRGDVTDERGFFLIENLQPGTYTITFNHISFHAKSIADVVIIEGQTLDLNTIILEQRVLNLESVIVTATRTDRSEVEVSQQINVVPHRRILERNVKTSAEALREESGIFIQKTSHGGGSAIIRGLSSNQILILVDGVRLNNSTYRMGNHQYLTTIDNHIVEQLEVVRGPTSVLYGSDALGGTINALTEKPDLTEDRVEVDYRLMSRFATADAEKTASAECMLKAPKMAVQTNFSYKDYGDLRRGANSKDIRLEKSTNGLKQSPTGFTALDFAAKAIFTPSSSQSLIAAYQLSRKKDVPRYDKYENDGYDRWLYQPQKRDLIYLSYENSLHSRLVSSLRATISVHRQEEGRVMQKSASTPLTEELDKVNTWGATVQLNTISGHHLFTYGSEIYMDFVSSRSQTTNTMTQITEEDERGRYPDGSRYHAFGTYFQDEIRLAARTRLIAGFRYSHFGTEFSLVEAAPLETIKQRFQSVTGHLGIIQRIGRGLYLNANVGQAFRAPNLSDFSKLGESKGNVFEVPNPDLVPEKMINIDGGLKWKRNRCQGNISAYYGRIGDLLASADDTYNGSPTIERNGQTYKIKSKQNIGSATICGIEFSFDYTVFRDFTLFGNISSPYGHNTTLDEPVGKMPPTFGMAGMRWRSGITFAQLHVRFAGAQKRLSSDDLDDPRIPEGGTPGWVTLNIRGGFNIWNLGVLRLALENILDLNYREHASGVNGPGRNFIVSVELRN